MCTALHRCALSGHTSSLAGRSEYCTTFERFVRRLRTGVTVSSCLGARCSLIYSQLLDILILLLQHMWIPFDAAFYC